MNTTEIQIEQTIKSKVSIKIEIPSYWKTNNQYFKVYSNERALMVWDSVIPHLNQIDTRDINSVFDNKDLTEITEAMFNEHYTKVVEQFNSL